MRWGEWVGRAAALATALSVLGCSRHKQNVPVPRSSETFWTEKDWRGASVHVSAARGTQDLVPIIEGAFEYADFIVVGTPEEARLVIRLEQRHTSGGSGSVGAQYYSFGERIVDAVASYDGRRVADAHVELRFTVARREEESWAEYTWREDLETAAGDKYVGGNIAEQILARLPLRASIAPAAKETGSAR